MADKKETRKKTNDKKDTSAITLYEEEFYKDEETKQKGVRIVVFRLAEEWYGVEIARTKEVIKPGNITYLPSSPEYITGIVNLRGNILSVTDLKKIFSLPAEEQTERSRLVIVEAGVMETGLLADEIFGVIAVPENKIDPTLVTIPAERAEYVEGECKVDDKLIGVLSVDKIFEKEKEG